MRSILELSVRAIKRFRAERLYGIQSTFVLSYKQSMTFILKTIVEKFSVTEEEAKQYMTR